MKFIHAAVSMNPSDGVVRQMREEGEAAAQLGLPWETLVSRGEEGRRTSGFWSAALRYAVLRIRFYARLASLARQGHRIVLRYSPGDPFLFVASFFLRDYVTVHHTLEEDELRGSEERFAGLQLTLERNMGRHVVARARGLVCVTPEVARHESRRSPARRSRIIHIYPNGILYPEHALPDTDLRSDRPEILFVASYFYDWHGLDVLLDSMATSGDEAILHLVGTLPAFVRTRAANDQRMQLHGELAQSQMETLMARSWLGLSSFRLDRKGMTEACTLKVREYLRAGLPVYAGHSDSALPVEFPYYRSGPPDWHAIVKHAMALRWVGRDIVSSAARPFIDKKILLAALHRSLSD